MTTADDAPLADAVPATPRQLSTTSFIAIIAALSVVAAAVGILAGLQIASSAETALARKGEETPAAAPAHVESGTLRPLTPIVTNLAGSPTVWIRIEASLVFHEIPEDADALSARITEDIVGFLRTVTVRQVEGATGFQHLSEDLNDRVRVRSNGRVRELVIQGLIIE